MSWSKKSVVLITFISLLFICSNFTYAKNILKDAENIWKESNLCKNIKKENVNTVTNKLLPKISTENLDTFVCNHYTKLTPLHQALIDNRGPEIVNALLEKGMNTTKSDIYGKHILHFAAKNKKHSSIPAKALINSGLSKVDPSAFIAIDHDGKTALHYAAENGNTDFINLISNHYLHNFINVNALDNKNRTALFYAVIMEHKDTVDSLVQVGAKLGWGAPVCPLLEERNTFANRTISILCKYTNETALAEMNENYGKLFEYLQIFLGIWVLTIYLYTTAVEAFNFIKVKVKTFFGQLDELNGFKAFMSKKLRLFLKEEETKSGDIKIIKVSNKASTPKITTAKKRERGTAKAAKTPKASPARIRQKRKEA